MNQREVLSFEKFNIAHHFRLATVPPEQFKAHVFVITEKFLMDPQGFQALPCNPPTFLPGRCLKYLNDIIHIIHIGGFIHADPDGLIGKIPEIDPFSHGKGFDLLYSEAGGYPDS